MTRQSLQITLQPQAAAAEAELWVRLENLSQPEVGQYANLYDADQMMERARSGLSAWSYIKDGCPIRINSDGTVDVSLSFYSFPSSFEFPYQVTASIGTLGEPVRVERERELDVVFTGSRYDLPWVATMASVEWISPCFLADGSQVARPHITIEDTALTIGQDIAFGVARLKCIAHGFLHTTVIRLRKQTRDKDENGNLNVTGFKIENLRCAAIAAWTDETGEKQTDRLDLDVPRCVEDYLAECPDGDPKGCLNCRDDGEPPGPTVYYSSCTGSVLLVLYPED